MKEKELWGVTKTIKSVNTDVPGNWLIKSKDLWVAEGNFAASFTDKGEARKALNKKLSFEIENWGMGHVKRWIYKVERIKRNKHN